MANQRAAGPIWEWLARHHPLDQRALQSLSVDDDATDKANPIFSRAVKQKRLAAPHSPARASALSSANQCFLRVSHSPPLTRLRGMGGQTYCNRCMIVVCVVVTDGITQLLQLKNPTINRQKLMQLRGTRVDMCMTSSALAMSEHEMAAA